MTKFVQRKKHWYQSHLHVHTLSKSALQVLVSIALATRLGLVTRRSSPTTYIPHAKYYNIRTHNLSKDQKLICKRLMQQAGD